jgi:endonuclease-3
MANAKTEKASMTITALSKEFGQDDGPPWNLGNPFHCLIGTVLSARTRDENASRAAGALLEAYPDPRSLSEASVEEIERLIRPSGFYRVKARRVKKLASSLIRHHGGRVPNNMDELVSLPGVGRKTAGCVLVYSFGKPAIPVDVHVHRISNRIGIVDTKKPRETELELMKTVPKDKWIVINHLLVRFGQNICKPLKPECRRCPVTLLCDYPHKNVRGD